MHPTMKLRIVLRQVPAPEFGPNISKAKEVHQQWWEGESVPGRNDDGGEWRDIPIEVEE